MSKRTATFFFKSQKLLAEFDTQSKTLRVLSNGECVLSAVANSQGIIDIISQNSIIDPAVHQHIVSSAYLQILLTFDGQSFMELAIETAAKCPTKDKNKENDSRVNPKVGAVAVRNGEVLASAYRGEEVPPSSGVCECSDSPGNGDHAEFILITKKLKHLGDLSDVTIYTTLEPCTTKRTPPKRPCLEWLVSRKVAKVVIGMLDPDPEILGKGVEGLRDKNIEVQLFPGDLAKRVESQNADFILSKRALRQNSVCKKSAPPGGNGGGTPPPSNNGGGISSSVAVGDTSPPSDNEGAPPSSDTSGREPPSLSHSQANFSSVPCPPGKDSLNKFYSYCIAINLGQPFISKELENEILNLLFSQDVFKFTTAWLAKYSKSSLGENDKIVRIGYPKSPYGNVWYGYSFTIDKSTIEISFTEASDSMPLFSFVSFLEELIELCAVASKITEKTKEIYKIYTKQLSASIRLWGSDALKWSVDNSEVTNFNEDMFDTIGHWPNDTMIEIKADDLAGLGYYDILERLLYKFISSFKFIQGPTGFESSPRIPIKLNGNVLKQKYFSMLSSLKGRESETMRKRSEK